MDLDRNAVAVFNVVSDTLYTCVAEGLMSVAEGLMSVTEGLISVTVGLIPVKESVEELSED